MRKLVKYTTFTLLGLVAGFFLLVAYVYVTTVNMFDRRYPVVPSPIAAAIGAEAIARGKALADRTGCTDCHKADLRGGLFSDDGWQHGQYYASNLTLKAKAYSDEDFARIVRLGVRPDGRSVVAMPSSGFVRLTDGEMADIIAFVRSLPAGGIEQPEHHIGPVDRWDFMIGAPDFKPGVTYVDEELRKDPADAGPQHAAARHLTSIVCRECHGGDLKGHAWGAAEPDLAVAAAYGLPEFTRLLRTGIGADGKEHGLMTSVARGRLHHLTDQEIAGIHAYLLARASLPR
ncbi:MAG TPA: c-type cytochrome [Casimicrobiaceae bacterium]|nr:c-type cytochrome [Casimicrobiaceae bacterium]